MSGKIRAAAIFLAVLLMFSCVSLPAHARSYKEDDIASADVGDTVFFGNYEQNDDEDDGKEPIEWIVLAKKEDRILVISKYVLAAGKYHERSTSVTWKDCSLREWLNDDFLEDAFTKEEIGKIPTVTVKADKNPKYGTNPGKDTKDQIFLLSAKEAKKYFDSNAGRQCKPTKTAKEQDVYVKSGYCWWWLRTPGDYGYKAMAVRNNGELLNGGYTVHNGGKANSKKTYGGIRPAMWIQITE